MELGPVTKLTLQQGAGCGVGQDSNQGKLGAIQAE